MTAPSRLVPVDLLRGAIIVLMALDHASLLVAHVHATEFWGHPLPVYDDAAWFLTRFVTHVCAPGFFLLMGVGMACSARGPGHFAVRGLLLIALQVFVENPAWLLGTLSADPASAPAGAGKLADGQVAGGGSGILVHMGVLYALGLSMLVWGLLRRLPSAAILLLGVLAIAASAALLPAGAEAEVLFAPLPRLLWIPGHSDWLQVFYPALPWMGVAGFGIVLGRGLQRAPEAAVRRLPVYGVALLAVFVALRMAGLGDAHAPGPGWIGWLNLTKYPPGAAYLALTLGAVLLALAGLARRPDAAVAEGHPLLVFGRAPLCFYLAHLYLYAALGFLVPKVHGLGTIYAAWLLGLALLYLPVRRYGAFKRTRPRDSLWRLL